MYTFVLLAAFAQTPGEALDTSLNALDTSTASQQAQLDALTAEFGALQAQQAANIVVINALTSSVAALEAQLGSVSPVAGRFIATDYMTAGEDLSDAIHAITLACNGPIQRAGCEIVIPQGTYVTKQIKVCKGHHIYGTGGPENTRIQTSSTTAFKIATFEDCREYDTAQPSTCVGGACPFGAGALIEKLSMYDTAGFWDAVTNPDPIYSAGVWMESSAYVRNVVIDGFTQGIRVNAGFEGRPAPGLDGESGWPFAARSNANGFMIGPRVIINDTRHSGIHIEGEDANAGLEINASLGTTCEDGDIYEAWGWEECAGHAERSFLGNVVVGGQCASSNDARGGGHGCWVAEDSPGGANSQSLFLGVYGENEGSELSYNRLGPFDISVGGFAKWRDSPSSVIIQGRGSRGMCFSDTSTVGNPLGARICLGDKAVTLDGLVSIDGRVAPFSTSNPLKLRLVDRGGTIGPAMNFTFGGFNQGIADVRMQDGSPRAGTMWLYQRVLLDLCAGAEGVSSLDGAKVINDSNGISFCDSGEQ